ELVQLSPEPAENGKLAEIPGLLRRRFSDGDSNYKAQFWSARPESLYGDRARATRIYEALSKRAHPYVDTSRKRAPVRQVDGSLQLYTGSVVSVKGDFAFVSCTQLGSNVYLHRSEMKGEWSTLHVGDGLRFKVGFSFRGPACLEAVLT